MFFKKSKILTGLLLASFGVSANPWSDFYDVSVPSYAWSNKRSDGR